MSRRGRRGRFGEGGCGNLRHDGGAGVRRGRDALERGGGRGSRGGRGFAAGERHERYAKSEGERQAQVEIAAPRPQRIRRVIFSIIVFDMPPSARNQARASVRLWHPNSFRLSNVGGYREVIARK